MFEKCHYRTNPYSISIESSAMFPLDLCVGISPTENASGRNITVGEPGKNKTCVQCGKSMSPEEVAFERH